MKPNTVLHLIIVSVLATTFGVACKADAAKNTNTTATETIPVKVLALQKEQLQQSLTVSGQFTTEDETFLSFKTGGVISRIYVKEGDKVTRGQLLATLDLTEMNAAVQQATIGYEKAQRDYKRAENLYADSVATLEQVQNAKTGADLARQQLQSIQFNQQYSTIRATANGYVLHKMVQEGQVIEPGKPVLQINGANSSKWALKVNVSDREWAVIEKGDKAEVTTDAFPGRSFAAVVSNKLQGVDPATGTFSITLTLKDELKLAAGLFGKATLTPKYTTTSWTIPYDALLDGDAGSGFVFVTNDNKTAEKVKVTVGGISKGAVLITSGLENAKSLIVSGNAYLNDRSAITILQ